MSRRDPKTFIADLIRRNPDALHRYQQMLQPAATREAAPGSLAEPTVEGVVAMAARADRAVLETIVSRERPVYFALPGASPDAPMTFDGSDVVLKGPEAERLDAALKAASATINPVIARVGRLDIEGMPGMPFAGTGWLIDDGILVTNRHVASVFGWPDGRRFRFQFGSNGRPLSVLWNSGHFRGLDDGGVSVAVSDILYIEPEDSPYDIAFLKLAASGLSGTLAPLPIAASVQEGMRVCSIGYPAKAPASIIPDQKLMTQLYQDIYDVKRLAPGLVQHAGAALLTHDCTTLGGNSGSAVVSIETGAVVGLHFAGIYRTENQAVPAAVLAEYRSRRRWVAVPSIETGSVPGPQPANVATLPNPAGGTVITITIAVNAAGQAAAPDVHIGGAAAMPVDVEAAVCDFLDTRQPGVIAARVGYADVGLRFDDRPYIAASVRPDRIAALRFSGPAMHRGFEVRYAAATLSEQLEAEATQELPRAKHAYDDLARNGDEFSFTPVTEEMEVCAHLSPEYGLDELERFLAADGVQGMDSAIYEFDGALIAEMLEARLKAGASLRMTIDGASLPRTDKQGAKLESHRGDLEIDAAATFVRWKQAYGERFNFVKVPEGASGLIANAYHIKVTVRDDDVFWLSSGNWKNTSSQPVVGDDQRASALTDDLPGNREWHVVVSSKTLSQRLRSHIRQDKQRSEALIAAGHRETAERAFDVMLPSDTEAGVEERRAPARLLKPLIVSGKVTATPLLTPDRDGRVYTDAVLDLIRSAQQQLWFQIPYIGMRRDPRQHRGNIDELIDALVDKLKTLPDGRVILRTGNSAFSDNRHVAWYFKSRGVDIDTCLRQIDDTHTKGMVIDGERVLIGSHNWSGDGVRINRDASLIFEDRRIAGYFGDAFLIDWQRARAVKAKQFVREMPLLLPSNAPASEAAGMRRVSLKDYLAELDD